VASLIQRSWSDNKKQPLFYTADFLRSAFEYPGSTVSLAPTFYEGSIPLAFSSGFPRRLRFKDQPLRVIVSSFLSVSPEHKKAGYGILLWNELVKRVQCAGFDGMVNFCVDGEPMNGMILRCCHSLRLPTARIFSVHYLSRAISQLKPTEPLDSLSVETVEEFLDLTRVIAECTPLARLWSQDEAEWQCFRRLGAVTARYSSGSRLGILTGYIMEIFSPERPKCLLIEDVLWGTLDLQERQMLLGQLLRKAAAAGARMATVPLLNYADMEPFFTARFQRTRRILHGYLSIWTGAQPVEGINSMYLDVF